MILTVIQKTQINFSLLQVILENNFIRILNREHVEESHLFFTSLLLLYNVDYHDEDVYRYKNGFLLHQPMGLLIVLTFERLDQWFSNGSHLGH